MITFYCPNCWSEISGGDEVCPVCGYILEDYSRLSLEEKLVMSLRHPAPDKQMMAVQILGKLGSLLALPRFEAILSDPNTDVYLLREVIQALSNIQHPKSAKLLEKSKTHSSPFIRRQAEALWKKFEAGAKDAG